MPGRIEEMLVRLVCARLICAGNVVASINSLVALVLRLTRRRALNSSVSCRITPESGSNWPTQGSRASTVCLS